MGWGRGTNRNAGLIVAVKLGLCELWQIRKVASPQAGVQGRGGAIRIKTAKLDLLLIGLYPPPLGDWATDKLYEWADKMVHAAPSRCCVVVGGDLNAHVGYMQHPEREALNLERDHGGMWGVSTRACELQRRAIVQVLPGSAHGDGEHTLPLRWSHILECTERQRSRIETGLYFASSHATSNGYTLFCPSKRGPTPSAHSSPTPT